MKTSTLLRQWNGPLTEELRLRSGPFGLGKIPGRLQPEATTRSVCGYCSTGCSLEVHLRDGQPVNLTPSAAYPVNLGMACPKGWEALAPLDAPDRGVTPWIRSPQGTPQPVDWKQALQTFTDRFRHIMDRHGRESVAFLSTGQICTEEMAFLGSLFKFGMGGRHGDSNTRQCMATAHVAYKQSFGFDAPPYTYADFEASDVMLFIGSNLCIAHPILWQRVLRNPGRPEIIVIDPRATETSMAATQHLALRPKSDLVLLYGLAHLLIQRGWIDRRFIEAHTSGFDAFADFVCPFTPDRVAEETRLPVETLERCAASIHRGRAVSFWWTMGVNQSHEATRTAQAIINLALITGNIGRPGTGANSITGQCNAMGSRLFANTTSLLGGRDFNQADHRREVATILQIPEEQIRPESSLAYDQIIDGIEAGTIRGLWVVATNTAHSWIDQDRIARLLGRLEFLVVQDLYTTTETARHAHLFLPAAGWGEKDGTMINSERRIGLVKKVARAPGLALSDFHIFRLIAQAWGCGHTFARWDSPEATFQMLKQLSVGRPCDFSGIQDYAHLEAAGGIQWPYPPEAAQASPDSPSRATERRLFSDGRFFTPDQRARLIFEAPRPARELVCSDYPMVLLTGRGTSAQWHTQTRTEKSAVLRMLYPQSIYIEIHPDDAHRFGIAPQGWVQVSSRRAQILCRAFVTPTVPPGQVFIPMHYRETNRLTHAEFDPYSRQPSYKHCAVRVESAQPGSALAQTSG